MAEIFRIYLPITSPLLDNRAALRGFWEAAVIEQGGKPVAGGVTVRVVPFTGRVVVAGRAERPAVPWQCPCDVSDCATFCIERQCRCKGGTFGPPHPTCVDVTRIGKQPGTEWVCGPECPRS